MFVGVGASVTGDTPVLIKTDSSTNLAPIGEFVDGFYAEGETGFTVQTKGIKCLGFETEKTAFRGVRPDSEKQFFSHSAWKDVSHVYRHKVDHIYEVHHLDGVIRATGDHSVFVRKKNFIGATKVSDLKPGDKLVSLPFKVRSSFVPGLGTTHKVKAHPFPSEMSVKEFPVWDDDPALTEKHKIVLEGFGHMSQSSVAANVGVSQATVGNWQRGVHMPRGLTRKIARTPVPEVVDLTPGLMKLFGYYTAEGRDNGYLEFVFGSHEEKVHKDCTDLMEKAFGLEPMLEKTVDNSLRIKYLSAPLGHFFARYCGNGSHNKHIPEFLWDAPKEYFLPYLEGYSTGDGYTTKEGKLVVCSVSKQLILELAWLCCMHGIKVGVGTTKSPAGRIIKSRPLPETIAWRLTIGKTAHPFSGDKDYPDQFKKSYVKKIVRKPYDGYVYDLCGVENEAFFGGEKPTLLHNSRVRDLFEQGKKNAPCIIFIDEIDAVGRHRGAGIGGGHDEREQTLNQLLVEMDGFESNEGVIIMAATNRPDVLDPALLRPGRFDRRVIVQSPDVKGREGILKVHAKKIALSDGVELAVIARGTPGFSGADLESVVNEAALLAARYNKNNVEMVDFEMAKDKVLMGSERKSMMISDEEKKNTAYHEAGHTLVARMIPGTDPIHKVTIIPRGHSLGLTQQLPTDDRYTQNKRFCENGLAILLGGRAAEEIVFNQPTTGAGNDIERATELARKMVCEWGMSPKIGPLAFGRKEEHIFLGREITQHKDYSDETAREIDAEIRKLIIEGHDKAKQLISSNIDTLKRLAEALLEYESLNGIEIDDIIKGKPIVRNNSSEKKVVEETAAEKETKKKTVKEKIPTTEPSKA
ncbi:AAA family ATPase [bacterium]|nr:AAA family ATPase [bacterium]